MNTSSSSSESTPLLLQPVSIVDNDVTMTRNNNSTTTSQSQSQSSSYQHPSSATSNTNSSSSSSSSSNPSSYSLQSSSTYSLTSPSTSSSVSYDVLKPSYTQRSVTDDSEMSGSMSEPEPAQHTDSADSDTENDTEADEKENENDESDDHIPSFCQTCCPTICWPARGHMPARDYLTLNAWEKFRIYRRLPWKFIMNLLLVISTTSLVIVLNISVGPYSRASDALWEFLLAPTQGEKPSASDTYGTNKVHYLYEAQQIVDSVQKTATVYHTLEDLAIDHFEHFADEQGNRLPVLMTVRSFAAGSNIFDFNIPFNNTKITTEYYLDSASDIGPFTPHPTLSDPDGITAQREYIHALDHILLTFSVKNYEIAFGSRTCFQWDVLVRYDFSLRGRVDMTIDSNGKLCPEAIMNAWYERSVAHELWLYFIVATCAIIAQILHFKSIYREFQIYSAVKYHHSAKQKEERLAAARAARLAAGGPSDDPANDSDLDDPIERITWESLSFGDKMQFFNIWTIIALIGNICNVTAPVIAIYDAVMLHGSSEARLYLTGLGAMMAWITMVQYFEGAKNYYVLITTLRTGTPRVARFIIGILPVFLGYAMLGVTLFSADSERFATLDRTCVTLFSLMNGDAIHEVFDDLGAVHPILSRVYLYSFITLFIYAVLNIIIAIMEDAFFASKVFKKTLKPREMVDMSDDEDSPETNYPLRPGPAARAKFALDSEKKQKGEGKKFDPLSLIDRTPITPTRSGYQTPRVSLVRSQTGLPYMSLSSRNNLITPPDSPAKQSSFANRSRASQSSDNLSGLLSGSSASTTSASTTSASSAFPTSSSSGTTRNSMARSASTSQIAEERSSGESTPPITATTATTGTTGTTIVTTAAFSSSSSGTPTSSSTSSATKSHHSKITPSLNTASVSVIPSSISSPEQPQRRVSGSSLTSPSNLPSSSSSLSSLSSSSSSSSPSNSSLSPAASELLHQLSSMQHSFSKEFQSRLQHYIQSSSLPLLRPPHDPR